MTSEDNFRDITEGLFKPAYELFKQLQDYLKVLITLNTATILIMVALLEKIFPSPKLRFLIVVSFISFVLSLTASLLMMTSISRFYNFLAELNMSLIDLWLSKDLSNIDAKKTELQKKASEISKSKINLYGLGNYFYLGGVLILIIFVTVNFLSK